MAKKQHYLHNRFPKTANDPQADLRVFKGTVVVFSQGRSLMFSHGRFEALSRIASGFIGRVRKKKRSVPAASIRDVQLDPLIDHGPPSE